MGQPAVAKLYVLFKTGILTTLLLCVMIQTITGHDFPPAVNVSDIFTWKTDDPWKQGKCPFINSKQYMEELAEHVAMEEPIHVKLIIGPKDAGKSTGIMKLIPKWKELGHVIVDSNLKGLSHSINRETAMKMLSNQMMEQLINFDVATYGRIYGCTSDRCGNNWGVGMIMWVARNIQLIFYFVSTIGYRYLDKIRWL